MYTLNLTLRGWYQEAKIHMFKAWTSLSVSTLGQQMVCSIYCIESVSRVASLSPDLASVFPNLISSRLEISMSDSSLNEYGMFEHDFDMDSFVSLFRISSAWERSSVDLDILSSAGIDDVCLWTSDWADVDWERHKLFRRANKP